MMAKTIHCSPESLNRSYAAPEIENQRKVTMEALSVQRGETVLDVGCGSGFLTMELARAVGDTGSVLALDISEKMVQAARERCHGLSQVCIREGDVTNLGLPAGSFDVVTCTQVLLYVAEVEEALGQMVEALRSGGRLAILETDWRGVVLNSRHSELTDTIYRAWDEAVPSPNLPTQLLPLLRMIGLKKVQVTAIPLLNTKYDPGSFSVSTLESFANNAVKKGRITEDQARQWRAGLETTGQDDTYFFCVNRFLFVGYKS